jgi:membrane associated rhomboid family serine protease
MGLKGIFKRPAGAIEGVDTEKFDSHLYRSFRNQLWIYHSWVALGLGLCFCIVQYWLLNKFDLDFKQISNADLIDMGGAYRILMFDSEPWRLLTSLFVHSSLISLAINFLALLSIGALVDRYEGSLRAFIIFIFSGVSANIIASFFQEPGVAWSGATGGIFGLYFAFISVSSKVDFRLLRKVDWLIIPFFLWNSFSISSNVPLSFAGAVLGSVFLICIHRPHFSSLSAKATLLAGWSVFSYLMVDKLLPTLPIVKTEIELAKSSLSIERSRNILSAATAFLKIRSKFETRYASVLNESLAISDMKVWMINEFHPELKAMRQTLALLRSPTMKIYAVQKSVFEDVILLDKICQEIAGGFVGDQLPYWQSIGLALEPSLKNIQTTLTEAKASGLRTADSK